MSLDPEPAPALIGQRLGRYLVVGQLGVGGMGEVYRARDEQLGRDVALKLLPADVAADRDRLARFDREGRALAALNHPHIGAIYGLEEGQVQRAGPGGSAEPVRALVLELVPGDTLADRLARGPLPVATAIAYARQIADALDAAHEGGIVHRDLKPANIAITPDDVVKVLDFGLAKTTSPDLAEPSQALTLAGTRPGLVLGTAAYMSPEQARGLAVDKRTDIWAFGCVLYEMLTGRRAFHGATVTDILAAILERDPDWNALPATTPPHVHALLARCLEKNAKQRLRDIGDACQELTAGKSPAVAARRGVGPSTIAVTCAVAAVAGVLGFALRAGTDSGTSAPVAPLRVLRITHGPDSEFTPAISPDRKWVAYLRSTAPPHGRTDIWVKFLAGGDPINLTASADLDLSVSTAIGGLDIAPEGNRIAVMAKTRGVAGPYATWEVPAPLPGVPRKLLDDGMLGARWSPNGKQLVFIRAGASAGDGLWSADADNLRLT